jgi:hypothetical protein
MNLGKEITAETIMNSLEDQKVPKSTKMKILMLMNIPAKGNIDKIIKFPEIKKKIQEESAKLEEEINNTIKEEEFDTLLLKKYLEKIEDLLIGENIEKEIKKEGIKEKSIPFTYSKKFDVKETVKSFIKQEYKFYSKLNKDNKKANLVFALDFSSSMKGEKIEDLKKFMTFFFLKEKKKIKNIYLFNKDVKKANNLFEILKEKPTGETNIEKVLREIEKENSDSIIYLITDNMPTIGQEKDILKAIEELKAKNNKLIIILLKPEKKSIELAQKMTDKVLVLEGNYFRELIDFVK